MIRLSRAFALAVFAMAFSACASPLVGGECDEGYAACDGRCIDLTSDPRHCGGCGVVCDIEAACIASMCTTDYDGAVPDGSAVEGGMQEGGVIVLPDGRIVGPDGETIEPDGSRRDGDSVLPDGRIVGPDGEILGPDGEILGPDGEILGPDGEILGPDGEILGPDGEILGPDGEVIRPDGSGMDGGVIVLPDGRVVGPDGEILGPDGEVIRPDGSGMDGGVIVLPDGRVVGPDGEILGPDGEVIRPDGSGMDGGVIVLPDGRVVGPDGEILGPDGEVLGPDGQVLGPDGGADSDADPCPSNRDFCGGRCVDTATDSAHCGGCGVACEYWEACRGGMCMGACAPPLAFCTDSCVNRESDPDHCGSCGRRCSSGICRADECVNAPVGHIVLIGHDYRNTRAGMNRIAGNSVFLSANVPARVVVYEGTALASAIQGTDRAIDATATATGRTWTRTVTQANDLGVRLTGQDVLVIYSQHGATNAELSDLGTQWAAILHAFLARGGVIVAFDGFTENDGTWQILDAAGLVEVTSRTDVSGDDVEVVAPGDSVGIGAPLMYRGETSTVRFDSPDNTVVVRHVDGPVVIHRIVAF